MKQAAQTFRLSGRSEEGVSCDDAGLSVGATQLLRKAKDGGGWRPRPLDELNAELSATYGFPVDLARRLRLLGRVAEALNDGDLARAQIAALHLRLPDPPDGGADRATDPTEFVIRLVKANLLRALWEESEHPRWPSGSPDSVGGQFAPAGATGQAASQTDATQDASSAPSDTTTDQQRRLTFSTDIVDHDGTVSGTFFINPPSRLGGVIVQKVVSTDTTAGVPHTIQGWEAWIIPPGAIATGQGQADDEWSPPPRSAPRPSVATQRTITATARFYEGVTQSDLVNKHGFTRNGSGFSHDLLSTGTDPQIPTDHATPALVRTRSYTFW